MTIEQVNALLKLAHETGRRLRVSSIICNGHMVPAIIHVRLRGPDGEYGKARLYDWVTEMENGIVIGRWKPRA